MRDVSLAKSLKSHGVKIMLTTSVLKSKIADIRKDTKSLRGRIQTVLAHGAAHAFVHGDVTPLNDVFRATKGVNQKLMAQYIADNCYAKLQKDGTFKINRKARKADGFVAGETKEVHGDALIQKLNDADPWFTKAETAKTIAKELDLAQLIELTNKKIEAAKADGKVIKFDAARVEAGMTRLNELSAFTAEKVA